MAIQILALVLVSLSVSLVGSSDFICFVALSVFGAPGFGLNIRFVGLTLSSGREAVPLRVSVLVFCIGAVGLTLLRAADGAAAVGRLVVLVTLRFPLSTICLICLSLLVSTMCDYLLCYALNSLGLFV